MIEQNSFEKGISLSKRTRCVASPLPYRLLLYHISAQPSHCSPVFSLSCLRPTSHCSITPLIYGIFSIVDELQHPLSSAKESVDWLLSIQETDGNFARATRSIGESMGDLIAE